MKWIKVEDGVPEIPDGSYGVNVIVFNDNEVVADVIYHPQHGFYDVYDTLDEVYEFKNVTHWMYLPEPPKE